LNEIVLFLYSGFTAFFYAISKLFFMIIFINRVTFHFKLVFI